jgi:hypothetical protein
MQLPATPIKEPLCERHSEVLDLFCENDLELLCPQCRAVSDHYNHDLIPISKAAASYQKKLKNHMCHLRKQLENAEMECELQVSKSIKLMLKIRNWRKKLQLEFRQFNHFMGRQQVAVKTRLLSKVKVGEEKLEANRSEISGHISTLKNLWSEMRDKCLQTDLDLLGGVRNLYSRYRNIRPPAVSSYQLNESCPLPPHFFGLQKMISTFQVDLTLNRRMAHPTLMISKDLKSVKLDARSPYSILYSSSSYAVVQSQERFKSGRYFWQVEVRGTGSWSLGVHNELSSKRFMLPYQDSGCWQVEQDTNSQHDQQVSRFGVFLDYELGEVSFYNLISRSCLCNFSSKFTETLVPFFSIKYSSKCLTISLVREE